MREGKECNICGEFKLLDDYPKCKSCKDGYENRCKKCAAIKELARRRTKEGLIAAIYTSQKAHSRERFHVQPEYTLEELRKALMHMDAFHRLHKNWRLSGYETALRPSIDRLDNSIGYTKTNIQLTTWETNKANGHATSKNGTDTKQLKPVNQFTLDGEFIRSYFSMHEAARQTDVTQGNISNCCNKSSHTAGGFVFEFA